ncbi:MAG: hypothetical protein OSB19_14160 [Opitutaceae bacterium]|nr:hypothetical protein [Opitutaceae bacterium]
MAFSRTLSLSLHLSISLSLSLPAFAQPEYDYVDDIAPILEEYCVKCHGPEKQKSAFRLDSYEALLQAGESEEDPIEAHYPMDSPLMEYLLLPKSDDYAMPPEDEDSPSGDEILKIAHWIYQGAKSKTDLRAKLPIDELLGEAGFAALERLREKGAIIHKLSETNASLFADLQSLSHSLGSSDIEDLLALAPFIKDLKMTHLPDSAGKLEWIRNFEQLTHLNLSFSKIGDGIADSLNQLSSLEYLNLFGTQITDAEFQKLEVPLEGNLHLGQTRVNGRTLINAQAKESNRTIHGNPNLNATLDITENARSNSSQFNPIPNIEPGIQVSDSGIKHSFLVCGKFTGIFDEDGKVSWLGPRGARDGMVLENGNVLLSVKNEAREYKKNSHQIIWTYTLDQRNKELGTVFRLPNGNTLVVERGILPRLLEIDPQGNVAIEVPLQPETDNGHMQTRMARKLPNGNYLVPHLLAFKVKEYTPSGKVVNIISTDLPELGGLEAENWPFTAIRLPNGNTVVNLTHGNKTVEFAPDGSVAWICDNSHADGRFKDPCGGQRLPNGNTVIGSYGQTDPKMTKIFEVNRDKEVVWEFFHPEVKAHEIHIITTNGKPVKPVYR